MTYFEGNRCDFCETTFAAEFGKVVDLGDFFGAGWLALEHAWDEIEESAVSLDFCSLRCLVGWALVEKVGPDELAGILTEE